MILRAIFSIGLLCAALTIIALNSGLDALLASAQRLSPVTVGAVTLFLLAGCLLAALRLKFVAADLGYHLTFREALAAMSIGQLAGSVFFQIAGQLIGRSWFLSRRNVPAAATVVLTGYERVAALAVSLVLAAAGAFYIFGKITVNLDAGGADFLRLLAGLGLAVGAGAAFAWGRDIIGNVSLGPRAIFGAARSVAISAAIQLATMAAYLAAAHALAPSIAISDLAAASAIVMLSASLPISLGGWGLREVSAILVLGIVGLASSDAFTVSLLVGVVSIALVGALAFTASDFWKKPEAKTQPASIDYTRLIAWALPVMAATAVLFQIYIPFQSGKLNVNLADPVAVLGGVFFVLAAWKGGRLPAWRFPFTNLAVAVATVTIGIALLIGAYRFGFTPWAVTNKFIGWFVLLSFAATGALVVRTAGDEGFRVLLTTFVAATVAIVLLEAIGETVQNAGINLTGEWPVYAREGFAQNRNAFAFQLIMAAAAAIACTSGRRRIVFLAFIFLGLWLSGSRSGWIAIVLIVGTAVWLRAMTWRDGLAAVLLAAGVILLTLLPLILRALAEGGLSGLTEAIIFQRLALPESHSTAQRLYSMTVGWRMFLDHPVFGAGLGAFMHGEILNGRPALVIHSTPLWLLAEFGLVGFAVFCVPACLIFFRTLKDKRKDVASVVLVLALLGFATMAMPHEMLYQRSFWLLFGAALALVPLQAGASGRAQPA